MAMNNLVGSLAKDLERRRRQLGMGQHSLAKRAGLGTATVQRALTTGRATIETIFKIAEALSSDVCIAETQSVIEMRQKQAEAKARELVGLVQGTSALEAQAVDTKTIQEMFERTVVDLLKGSNRRLWDD